jgi:hypothetical protein
MPRDMKPLNEIGGLRLLGLCQCETGGVAVPLVPSLTPLPEFSHNWLHGVRTGWTGPAIAQNATSLSASFSRSRAGV